MNSGGVTGPIQYHMTQQITEYERRIQEYTPEIRIPDFEKMKKGLLARPTAHPDNSLAQAVQVLEELEANGPRPAQTAIECFDLRNRGTLLSQSSAKNADEAYSIIKNAYDAMAEKSSYVQMAAQD